MISTLVKVALFASVAVTSVVADFAINSPKLVQCKEATISWEPSKPDYTVLAVRATDPCGDALVDIGDFKTTITNWKVNVPAGTTIILSVTDSEDNEAWSGPLTVEKSDDASCLPSTSSSAAASTPTPANVSGSSTSGSSGAGSPPSGAGGVEALGGAANAAANPFSNAAISARQASTPIAALAGMVALFALL